MYSVLSFLLAVAIPVAVTAPAPVADGGPLITTHHSQTPLHGFKGCSNKDRGAIEDSFHEAHKMLSIKSVSEINFNSLTALDYFGPAHRNQDWQKDLQAVLMKASELDGDWDGADGATIFCRNDPGAPSDCSGESHAAIMVSNGPTSPGQDSNTTLTFCHQFFDYSTLDHAIKEGQRKEMADVRSYDNRARHWIQAFMLIDSIRAPMSSKNAQIADIKMVFPNAPEDEFRYVMTPFTTKLLARFDQERGTVPLAIRNAHNIAWFATTAYAESKVKEDNVINAPALRLDEDDAVAQSAIDRSGTVIGANLTPRDTLDLTKAKYITATDYPSNYWESIEKLTAS